MSVVGFDIGNAKCVIAVAKMHGINILLNEESRCETPSVVCFGEKQRHFESYGVTSAINYPKTTISQIKSLIGRKFADPDVQNELKMLPFETSEDPNGGILIHLEFLKTTYTFTTIQILAMLFAHLKAISEKASKTSISECVIGVPSYFTNSQRRAYLNAATIAGLKPFTRMIHDCTAIALSYGIYRADLPTSSPAYVAIVDIGHCDTQVSIASFEAGKMKILSHAFDRSLGGRDFDEVLFNHFAEQFKQQYDIDVYSNAKACVRLRAACEKLKKYLSASMEANLKIGGLMDEKDVKGIMTREEFEKLTSGLLDRVLITCNKALGDANLEAERVRCVEVVGSGSRIPAIIRQLYSLFGKQPRRSLNASESVAHGCALQSAILSPTFNVKEYEVRDSIPFSIGFSSDDGPVCDGSSDILFPKGEPIPSVKVVTFERSDSFHLEAFYANPHELPPGTSPKIGRFTIGPWEGSSHGDKTRVEVRIELNLHGIVRIESATLVEEGMEDKSKNIEVAVSENMYEEMSQEEVLEAREKELQLAQYDKMNERTIEKRNALASYFPGAKEKFEDEKYQRVASAEDKERIPKCLKETEELLQLGDGADATELAYSSKLQDLIKAMDPLLRRFNNSSESFYARKALSNLVQQCKSGRYDSQAKTQLQRQLIREECMKVEEWDMKTAQENHRLPPNVDPVAWASDWLNKAKELESKIKEILDS